MHLGLTKKVRQLYEAELKICRREVNIGNVDGVIIGGFDSYNETFSSSLDAAEKLNLTKKQRKPLRQLMWDTYRAAKKKTKVHESYVHQIAKDLGIPQRYIRMQEKKGNFGKALKMAHKFGYEGLVQAYSQVIVPKTKTQKISKKSAKNKK